jgi:hypothetical protein
MRTHTKWLLSGLAAAVLLGLGLSSASAKRIQISEQRFYIIWSTLQFREAMELQRVECPVTLLGSFHSRTISKVSGLLVGHIRHAILATERCTNGTAVILPTSLPWNLRFHGFSGTLPRIELIWLQLIVFSYKVTTGIECLYVTTATEPEIIEFSVARETGLVTNGAAAIGFSIRPLIGPPLCPTSTLGSFLGGPVRANREDSTTRIIVTLVQ